MGVEASLPWRERPSAAARERVARRLRDACGDQRLSVDTFVARLDSAYAARTTAELDLLVVDLPRSRPFARAAAEATLLLSATTVALRAAWQRPRTPRLVLPQAPRTVLGRNRECDCTVADRSVSGRHAELLHDGGRWAVRDLGSLNGTFVNGCRVVDPVPVAPGDELRLGGACFRLVAAPG